MSPPVPVREFQEEVERDFSVRSIGHLQISNLRGGIIVQGWALDKIRVKARRKAVAATPEEARQLFSAVDFRYRSQEGDIELSAEYGRDLGIEERLRERKEPRTSMDMIVQAPANFKLRVWTSHGNVAVKGWNAPVEVRTVTGAIQIDSSSSDTVSLLCPSCPIFVKGLRGSVRCIAGSGEVKISSLKGKQVYVETSSGTQRLGDIAAEQLYVSRSGDIVGNDLSGRIEFNSKSGRVELRGLSGFVSGHSDTGSIQAEMRKWRFLDKALIESVKGDIRLSLPKKFSGELDVWSVNGRVELAFPLQPLPYGRMMGPEPASRRKGLVGDGGEQLRVFTLEGNIQVSRGAP